MSGDGFEVVSVVGLGYIGLPTAAVLANRGLEVIGVDINERAVSAINEGRAHFFEPELEALVHNAVRNKKLRAVNKPEAAQAYVIAVPTPISESKSPDLGYVKAAGASIAPVLTSGNLVILESTSPVGTVEMLAAQLRELRPDLTFPQDAGEDADVLLAYCPERIIPGRMVTELIENDRIVGGMSLKSVEAASKLYKTFVRGAVVATNGRTAEMVKLTENAFRDVNIAFANELSKVCDKFGVDVWEVIELANHHPRVNILQPGPGVGGHCIAVDPWFIIDAAEGQAPLMHTARNVNDSKPAYVVDKVRELAKPGDTIACFGLAYKANTDDLRESPAVTVVERLAETNEHKIVVVEPNVETLPSRFAGLNLARATLKEALETAQVVLLLVDHDEFKELSAEQLAGKTYYDSRGAWRHLSA
ncbi:UDP-N-acetyl-D-glucosamine 6-dehydrogenase [Roseibium album]|nr:UDP-N-acetyl-D-glucosamine 6-dehydrogenase [Roseibium album]